MAEREFCSYNQVVPSWDEAKRQTNLRLHRLDFAGAEVIWDGPTVTREDLRQDYGERRLVTFGQLQDQVVVLVHVERDDDVHFISLRRAESHETRYYFAATRDLLR